MYLQIHDVTGSPNREIFIVTDNCVRQKTPWFLMHCHSIYDDMYHSSGQLHQRFALRTLLVILGDQFTVSNMIDEKVTGMLLAAFMTWKSLLFWCSSSSLFQLYNCKFSVYRKKKSVWFLDYSQRFNSHQLNLKLGLVWHKLIIVLFASLNFMKIKYVWGSSRTSRKSSNISRSATGQVLLHKDTFQPFRR